MLNTNFLHLSDHFKLISNVFTETLELIANVLHTAHQRDQFTFSITLHSLHFYITIVNCESKK